MPDPRQPRPLTTERKGGGPSAMARASGILPHRPYKYRGETEEPPEVTAARERHRAVNAQLAAERDGTFAAGPGTGWDPLAATELAGDAPPPPPPAVRCGACGYLTTAPGHLIQCGGGQP